MGILVQSSGSTRWFDHNDLNLEVLLSVEKEREKEVRDSTRKFIGIFQKEGAMASWQVVIMYTLAARISR